MVRQPKISVTSQRKVEQLDIATHEEIQSPGSPGWEDIQLDHRCLPEVDLPDVDLSVSFLGHQLQAPIVIVAITGGHPRSTEINRRLALAAEHFGIAMGVGSQRAAIEHPELLSTYTIARTTAPRAFIIANIGVAQLIPQSDCRSCSSGQISAVVEAMSANALALHLNFLHEACQPRGHIRARGCAQAIKTICESAGVPVIAKETGSGMNATDAQRLRDLGVLALDVGGYGGSSMAILEARRAERQNDPRHGHIAAAFASWGIPTAVSVVEAQAAGLPIIATGGVRSGLDAAKAINLGATLVGLGQPALAQAEAGEAPLLAWLEDFIAELRITTFLTGSRDLAQLQTSRRFIFGRTAEWLEQLAPQKALPKNRSKQNKVSE